MKKLLFLVPVMALSIACHSQGNEDKSKRPSPPAKVTETTKDGLMISIDYSQPAVNGRTIGKDLEPLPGKVWRTGANETTVFEISKDAKIEGKTLPAGKYALFTLANGDDWTIIFNKTIKWGAFSYKESEDVLRVNVKSKKSDKFAERFTITINKEGKVSMWWGNYDVDFWVK
jgi:hypothetical protein